MAAATKKKPGKQAGGIKGALTRKFGPLPAWGWLVIIGGGIFLWSRHSGGASSSGASGAATGLTTPDTSSGTGGSIDSGSGGGSGGAPTDSGLPTASGQVAFDPNALAAAIASGLSGLFGSRTDPTTGASASAVSGSSPTSAQSPGFEAAATTTVVRGASSVGTATKSAGQTIGKATQKVGGSVGQGSSEAVSGAFSLLGGGSSKTVDKAASTPAPAPKPAAPPKVTAAPPSSKIVKTPGGLVHTKAGGL